MSDSGDEGKNAAGDANAAAFPASANVLPETVIPETRPLSAAARRALAEAEARRVAYEAHAATLPKELGGRGGKEPGRYGDWEVKGIASDF